MIEIPAPSSWIFARAISAHSRPIEYDFNPSAHAASGFRLYAPKRLDHFHNEINVDVLDGQGAKHRRYVGGERISPLLAVFFVSPAYFMRADVGLGALVECHGVCGR